MSLTHNHQLHPSEEVIENHQQQRAGEYIAKKQLLAKVTSTFLRFVLIKTNGKIAQTEGQLEGEGVFLAPTAAG